MASSKDLKKSYNEDNDEGYFVEADVQYPDNQYNLGNDLLFFLKDSKLEKLAWWRRICYPHKKFKTSIKSLEILKNVYRTIKFILKSLIKTKD